MENYCKNLKTIPQFSDTCWLNSILTVSLYSSGLQRVLINEFKYRKKDKTDKLFNFLLYMLKNENNINSFKDFRPELLLISFMNKYSKILKNIMKEKITRLGFSYYISFITVLFNSYNIPYINLSYINNSLYYDITYTTNMKENFKKTLDESHIIFIEKNINNINLDEIENKNFNVFKDNISSDYNTLLENIRTNNSIITINDYTYILDSFMISNYNNSTHVISGINCNKKRYLIDSIQSSNELEYKPKNKIKINYNPCKPYLYDWYINKRFCLNSEKCKITDNTINNYCYDFNESYLLLIYVKESSSIRISNELFNESNISYKDFNFSKKSVSLNIKDIYENIYNISNEELYNLLLKSEYTQQDLLYMKNIRANYGFLYEKLTKNPISIFPNKTNDDLFRDIAIPLIFKYLKKGVLYNLDRYRDEKTIYKIIGHHSGKSIDFYEKYLNDNYDYDRIYIEMIDKNLNDIYKKLFIDNKDFFDGHIKHKNMDNKKKQILVKILIGTEFLKRNYKKIIININHFKVYGKLPRSRSKST